MSDLQLYVGIDQRFDPGLMERIILTLADMYEVRIEWNYTTALLTGTCALAGGLVGNYAGGRLGAALGAGLGSVTGFGIAKMVSLREVWSLIKEQLKELLYIVFNFLRRLDPIDYLNAYEIVMASRASRRELVFVIMEVITSKLGREIVSNMITA